MTALRLYRIAQAFEQRLHFRKLPFVIIVYSNQFFTFANPRSPNNQSDRENQFVNVFNFIVFRENIISNKNLKNKTRFNNNSLATKIQTPLRFSRRMHRAGARFSTGKSSWNINGRHSCVETLPLRARSVPVPIFVQIHMQGEFKFEKFLSRNNGPVKRTAGGIVFVLWQFECALRYASAS